MKKEIILLAICFGLFVILKFIYSCIDINALRFFLVPTTWGVSLFTDSSYNFVNDSGYFFPQLNIVIDKSCSGFTFWSICFLMISFQGIQSKKIRKSLIIPASLIVSYFIAVIANVSRITGYIIIMHSDLCALLNIDNKWLHKVEGVFIYMIFLIIFYLVFNFILTKNNKTNEETTKSEMDIFH